MLLSQIKTGHKAVIRRISDACQGFERYRLLDLGVVPGSVIEPLFNSPLNDPRSYRIRSSVIALRKDQADKIEVEVTG